VQFGCLLCGSVRVRLAVDRVALRQFFSASVSILCCQYHSTRLHVHVKCCPYQKDKSAKPGNLPDNNALPQTGDHGTGKVLSLPSPAAASPQKALPWLGQLFAGLPPQRPVFDKESVRNI